MDAGGFGQLLAKYRSERKLTQQELAAKTNKEVSVKTISVLEKGHRHPHASTARKLADALDLTYRQKEALLSRAQIESSSPLLVFFTPNVRQISFWDRFSWALTEEAHKSGMDSDTPSHAVVPFYHNESIRLQLGQIRFCYNHLRHSIAGIIIAPACGLDAEDRKGEEELIPLLKSFWEEKIPVVFVDRRMTIGGYFYEGEEGGKDITDVGRLLNIPHIGLNDYIAGRKAAEALTMELALRDHMIPKVALVWDSKALSMHYLRAKGAREQLDRGGYYHPDLETFGDIGSTAPTAEDTYNFRGMGARARRLLGQRPDGVICGTSYIARMLCHQLHNAGSTLKPLIVCLDDIPDLNTLDQSVGRVNYKPGDLAHRAVRKIYALHNDDQTAHMDEWLEDDIEVYFEPSSTSGGLWPYFNGIDAM